ncbi:MAG: hypothetical protein R3B93_02035 [Bacteroidia bacterium]
MGGNFGGSFLVGIIVVIRDISNYSSYQSLAKDHVIDSLGSYDYKSYPSYNYDSISLLYDSIPLSAPKSLNHKKTIIENNETIKSKSIHYYKADRKEISFSNEREPNDKVKKNDNSDSNQNNKWTQEIGRLESISKNNLSAHSSLKNLSELLKKENLDSHENEIIELEGEIFKINRRIENINSEDKIYDLTIESIEMEKKVSQLRSTLLTQLINSKNNYFRSSEASFSDGSTGSLSSERIIEEQKKIMKGKIGYRIQDSMIVHKLSRIAMTIGENEIINDSVEKVIQNLTVIGEEPKSYKKDIKIDKIEIGERMRARLIDPQAPSFPAFNVKALSSETQVVDQKLKKLTSWQWDVYPLKEGEYVLNLVVDIVISLNGSETPVSIPVFDKKVSVNATVSEKHSFTSLNIIAKNNYFKWGLISLFVVTLVVLFLRYTFKLNSFQKPENAKITEITSLTPKLSIKGFDDEKIKKLIKEGKTEKGLDLLEDCTKSNKEIQNKIIIHKSRLKNLKESYAIGSISDEDFNKGVIKINIALLNLLEEIKKIN